MRIIRLFFPLEHKPGIKLSYSAPANVRHLQGSMLCMKAETSHRMKCVKILI